MRFWKYYPRDISAEVHNQHATDRDGVLSSDTANYALFNAVDVEGLRSPILLKRYRNQRNFEKAFFDKVTTARARTTPPSPTPQDVTLKRSASTQPADQPGPKRIRVFVPSNEKREGGGDDKDDPPSFLVFRSAWKVPIKLPPDISTVSRQAKKSGIEANDHDKDKKIHNDSDVVEIPAFATLGPKWKASAAAKIAESAKKKKGRRSELLEVSDMEDVPSSKESTVKGSSARGKIATPAKKLVAADDSEKGDDDSDEDDDGDDEQEALQTAKKHAQAEKELGKACRTCKTNANKAMKVKYETQISTLKREHKAAIRVLKYEGIAAAKRTKTKTDKEKREAKTKAEKKGEENVEEAKEACEKTFEAMKTKLGNEIKVLQKNLAGEKAKVQEFKMKFEIEEDARKKAVKASADAIKKTEADLKAGEARLKERAKALKRENLEEVNQLKPEHSKALKDKDAIIKDITQRFVKQEQELERSEEDLRRARTLHGAEKNHHQHSRKQLAEAKARVDELEDNLLKCNEYVKAVKERAQTDVARAEEETSRVRANLQQQSNRVVDKQRENYNLRDAMRTHAKLAEERKAKIEGLKKRLREAQAEIGVAEEMDGLVGGSVREGKTGGMV